MPLTEFIQTKISQVPKNLGEEPDQRSVKQVFAFGITLLSKDGYYEATFINIRNFSRSFQLKIDISQVLCF